MAQALAAHHFTYTGKVQPLSDQHDANEQLLRPYLPSPELVEAVNLAIYLERPLLLKGEPGSGKTRLAHAVAFELNLPYEEWHIKSTNRARDGLYMYDTIGRLRDAQLAAVGHVDAGDLERIADPAMYVRFGPLGRAFLNTQRTIVLIDEIDKADIDFPMTCYWSSMNAASSWKRPGKNTGHRRRRSSSSPATTSAIFPMLFCAAASSTIFISLQKNG
jgi:DNA polymerase III delta prime subunit